MMYADDMLIISQNVDLKVMTTELQDNLNRIIRWCNHNKLTMNKDKTKYMLVSNKTTDFGEKICIGEQPLCKLSQYEYLGLIIEKELKMVSHVDSMFKKANLKLGILCKIRRYISEETAIRVYKTMIRLYLEYVDFVIECSTKEKVERIDKLQDKAIRRIEFCNNTEDRESYEVLERSYKMEKLCVRRKRSLLRVMYIASKNTDNIEHVTRNINLPSSKKVQLKNNFSSLTKLHNSPYFRGLKLWDSLPENDQKAENTQIFKSEVKKLLL